MTDSTKKKPDHDAGGSAEGATADADAPTSGDAVDKFPDIAELDYESARDELIDVVRRLEAGGTRLEDALHLWERGEALANRCQQWLDGAKATLDAAVARRADAG